MATRFFLKPGKLKVLDWGQKLTQKAKLGNWISSKNSVKLSKVPMLTQ